MNQFKLISLDPILFNKTPASGAAVFRSRLETMFRRFIDLECQKHASLIRDQLSRDGAELNQDSGLTEQGRKLLALSRLSTYNRGDHYRSVIDAEQNEDVPQIYADLTAAGYRLGLIDRFVEEVIHPNFANTHTDVTHSGDSANLTFEAAIDIIKDHFGLESQHQEWIVAPAGSGSTGVIERLIQIMTSTHGASFSSQFQFITGIREHHSNYLPWQKISLESGTRFSVIDDKTLSSAEHYKEGDNPLINWYVLHHHHNQKRPFVSLNNGSNVTGKMLHPETLKEFAEYIKKRNGYLFLDLAGSAPYKAFDISPFDGIFVSPHKFQGALGTPGIGLFKTSLFDDDLAPFPGGGTVDVVTKEYTKFTDNYQEKVLPGTPNAYGTFVFAASILFMRLIGMDNIEHAERHINHSMGEFLNHHERIILHRELTDHQLPIWSIYIVGEGSTVDEPRPGQHQNFIAQVLNDFWGINGRPGCACAGPYNAGPLLHLEGAQMTFGIQRVPVITAYVGHIAAGNGGLKPGNYRLGLPYNSTEEDISFTKTALHHQAYFGHLLLEEYVFDFKTGSFKHINGTALSGLNRSIDHRQDSQLSELSHRQQLLKSEDYRRFLETNLSLMQGINTLEAETILANAFLELNHIRSEHREETTEQHRYTLMRQTEARNFEYTADKIITLAYEKLDTIIHKASVLSLVADFSRGIIDPTSFKEQFQTVLPGSEEFVDTYVLNNTPSSELTNLDEFPALKEGIINGSRGRTNRSLAWFYVHKDRIKDTENRLNTPLELNAIASKSLSSRFGQEEKESQDTERNVRKQTVDFTFCGFGFKKFG